METKWNERASKTAIYISYHSLTFISVTGSYIYSTE